MSPFARLMKKLSLIEAHELRATLGSFALVFMLMAGYYVLRPVRDSMASDWSDAEVSTLWTFTFLFSFIATALYGLAASRLRLKILVPGVYAFFAASFVAVYLLTTALPDPDLVNRFFYVWVSVFSLFQVSVFWSFMSDLYSTEQSQRLFAFITTGASVGAMVGPSVPVLFATELGNNNLLLIASAVLCATIPLIFFLQRLGAKELGSVHGGVGAAHIVDQKLGGNPLSGYRVFLQSPYLLAIGAFIFLYTGIGSFVYFELKNLMAAYSSEERTQIWGFMDLVVNTLTMLFGLFLTSRLTQRFGLAATLALIPVLIVGGLLTVALVPMLWVVVGLQIFRRAGNYGVTRPAREMLFTAVDRETRFKAKQVADVVVYRGGDVFWAWSFTGLTAILGLGMAGVALVGATIAAAWAGLGIYLGRRFQEREHEQQDEQAAQPT